MAEHVVVMKLTPLSFVLYCFLCLSVLFVACFSLSMLSISVTAANTHPCLLNERHRSHSHLILGTHYPPLVFHPLGCISNMTTLVPLPSLCPLAHHVHVYTHFHVPCSRRSRHDPNTITNIPCTMYISIYDLPCKSMTLLNTFFLASGGR